jgi:hypothetical protein
MEGMEVKLHASCSLSLDGGEWSAHAGCFTSGGKASFTPDLMWTQWWQRDENENPAMIKKRAYNPVCRYLLH